MSKKSVLLATLLAGMSAFTGCNEKENKTSKSNFGQDSEKIAQVLDQPIYLNELPHAMIIPTGQGKYVQLLYPVQKAGNVMESKDQYEKRIKWLNENDLVDPPKGLSLAGCRWQKRIKPSSMPFVSFFDNKEYLFRHIEWQQKFLNVKASEVVKKDPVTLWWLAQTELSKKNIQKVLKSGREI